MDGNRSLVRLQQVTVRRQNQWLLKDINFETKLGQHWALLGANGAGKTTLLQLLMGMMWPTSGDVWVIGHHLGEYDVRELRKEIGFVSNRMDGFLEQNLCAADLVAAGKYATSGLYATITEEDRHKAHHLLQEMGAGAIAWRAYGLLSQGERQKVVIARALMTDPKLLIIDEPCTGLDFPSREHVLSALEGFASDQQPQLLYVTHYPDEIFPAISHVAVLRHGELVASGPKREVLTNEVLSTAYELPVQLFWQDDRPTVRVKRETP